MTTNSKESKKLMDRDLYALFGIPSDVTQKEIKSAYRKKALVCHPDKNPDNPQAAELFQQLTDVSESSGENGVPLTSSESMQSARIAWINTNARTSSTLPPLCIQPPWRIDKRISFILSPDSRLYRSCRIPCFVRPMITVSKPRRTRTGNVGNSQKRLLTL